MFDAGDGENAAVVGDVDGLADDVGSGGEDCGAGGVGLAGDTPAVGGEADEETDRRVAVATNSAVAVTIWTSPL